ncbi:Endonuclease/exonuclease/phosphatase [Purpureocillium lavendulum]|uniref:Endonuclease/exonuclease/phosphatase n=1 Tax=Purpureocillium lavendulum TaxID=1247861 RepID=A0AB34FD72_9HYPO|nr:Endonuclease/exonuclease/phosphatase [Purpureocillium lavendulum]
MVRIAVAAALVFAVSALAIGDPTGAKNVGNGKGGQFITGACFQAGKTGCGFNDPNAKQTIAANKQKARQQGFKRLVSITGRI